MKVFLSSTYNDLIEHRKAAHDALEQLGLHVIWMEAFGARPVESTKACLDEIEESDLFVGIYAHRYGYIPEGADISITEQEFLHAKTKGKPVFGFIIDQDYPWSLKFVEHDKTTQINNFLKKVKTQPVKFFTTSENLASSIASSVGNYLKDNPVSNSQILDSEIRKPVGSTLPNQPYFFGRERELAIIGDSIASESRTWGALIDGPGGIGKTALAIRAAHLASEQLFERKIFITAKVRELTPEGEKPLVDFSRNNYISILNELALELGEEDILRLTPDERTNPLRMAMVGKKSLIIFDNLETLNEDERTRLYQFLSRLPEGNKAIVTSRRRDNIDARVIRLDRLSASEASLLMSEIAKNNPRLARESEKAKRDLYEIVNGNPLLMKWVCGQLGREGSAMYTIADAYKFIDNAPKGNDPLEYIFGDLLSTFSESETRILVALTHFTQPAKLNWIIDITGFSEQVTETILDDLNDRSVLISNNETRQFFLPSLATKFISKKRRRQILLSCLDLSQKAFEQIKDLGDREAVNVWKAERVFFDAAFYGMTKLIIIPFFESFLADENLGIPTEQYWSELDTRSNQELLGQINDEPDSIIKATRGWIHSTRLLKKMIDNYEVEQKLGSMETVEPLIRIFKTLYSSVLLDSTVLGAIRKTIAKQA